MAVVQLVEDDPVIRGALVRALTDVGHEVRPFGTAMAGLRAVTADPPDLVILDLGLPDLDGADALRMLRGVSDVPVIVATARTGEPDMIRLLEAGADDYITKPFTSKALSARINAVLRRARTARFPDRIDVGPLSIDPSRRTATLDGTELELTRREYDLLTYLAARVGRVVTRQEIVTEVWRQPYSGTEQTLDVHISWLRRKLGETAAKPRLLRTVRGVGLMLVDPS
ncbi:DNA-binding response regulator [Longispora fulva]|uniref:DNA-binding response OmpR family regulator n=1 Tax=Longispora fulva TaxID=619741 RepID=A0A8J7G7Y0_9ACTN|nr:response regulator transcription factor [Longispora fulva]MBG6134750.1 DNA-binding response OmpR family regulator [Longispora fulva]GIG61961.1 DNA-binding response regulator [Longispora fulva]